MIKKSYLDMRICIPINETSEQPLDAKVELIIAELQQNLAPFNGTIEDQNIFTKDIVYSSSRGEDFTQDDILSPIMSWMSMTEPFTSFNGHLYEIAREELYALVMDSLQGKHPNQAMDYFGYEEKMMVMDRMNNRIEKMMGMTVTGM